MGAEFRRTMHAEEDTIRTEEKSFGQDYRMNRIQTFENSAL